MIQVCFVVHNSVSLNNLVPFIEYVKSDVRFAKPYITFFKNDHHFDLLNQDIAALQCHYIEFDMTLGTSSFDIVIFAAHGGGHLYPKRTLKIHIQHGAGAGKLVNGFNYTYGKNWVLQDDECIYDIFFETGTKEAKRIAAQFSHVSQGLRVIGSPIADHLLKQQTQKKSTRQKWKIRPESHVIGLLSTWGKESLQYDLSKHKTFLDSLVSTDTIILITHPHSWKTAKHDPIHQQIKAINSDLHIIMPMSFPEILELLPVFDVAITDFTSLALFLTLLSIPLYTLKKYDRCELLDLRAPIAKLVNNCPIVSTRDQLFEPFNLSNAKNLSKHVGETTFSYRGECREQFLQVLIDEVQIKSLKNQ
jgi:hypothetical protein